MRLASGIQLGWQLDQTAGPLFDAVNKLSTGFWLSVGIRRPSETVTKMKTRNNKMKNKNDFENLFLFFFHFLIFFQNIVALFGNFLR